jgi:hypothetical protein
MVALKPAAERSCHVSVGRRFAGRGCAGAPSLFPAAVELGYYAGILTDPQLQSFMGKETFQIPTGRCDECGQTKTALGFVSLSSDESGPARHLCSACFNRWYMQRAG